ncbi:MAG: carboxypeptidase, partial [Pseudolabrys sp.]|nr:carboxypeptidase [Pseudolabrys sp.]
MKKTSLLRLALAIIVAGALGSAAAQESAKGLLRLLPADAVTEHSIATGKTRLAYTATAGTLAFYNQSGDQSASVFYT